jgi:hypothetical protein
MQGAHRNPLLYYNVWLPFEHPTHSASPITDLEPST